MSLYQCLAEFLHLSVTTGGNRRKQAEKKRLAGGNRQKQAETKMALPDENIMRTMVSPN